MTNATSLNEADLQAHLDAIDSAGTLAEQKTQVLDYYRYLAAHGHWYGNLGMAAASGGIEGPAGAAFAGRLANNYMIKIAERE
ncbi:hypothetical protein EZI54_21650 [Marinobacter halodurans]|uniref:Uncharacterized protein n=1 Tax=Marinobacter halodurans TaxID=2528979 RepID=A0ABY1ZER6_9GAMM|nr:hypothetical protein [Marinobacter halodurans]TBW48115.1 hypothetical protein EZI54_21650 [Marinobacter halodurans]